MRTGSVPTDAPVSQTAQLSIKIHVNSNFLLHGSGSECFLRTQNIKEFPNVRFWPVRGNQHAHHKPDPVPAPAPAPTPTSVSLTLDVGALL